MDLVDDEYWRSGWVLRKVCRPPRDLHLRSLRLPCWSISTATIGGGFRWTVGLGEGGLGSVRSNVEAVRDRGRPGVLSRATCLTGFDDEAWMTMRARARVYENRNAGHASRRQPRTSKGREIAELARKHGRVLA